jgi:hypothetical protein
MTALAFVLLLEASRTPPRDWIAVRDGAVELALVHRERDRLDGGILTVDPRRRVVLWKGIAGDVGCRLEVEASFDDVRSVAVGEPGFALEFRKGKGPRMLLIPRPHAEWLLKERKIVYRDAARVAEHILDPPPPDMVALPLSGASGSNAPTLIHPDLPSAVTADTRAAVDAIRDALGRTPAPSTLIREALSGSPREATPSEIAEAPAARVKAVRLAAGSSVRPVVVFAFPLEEDPIPSDTRFVIQFNKYMDEDSFAGHVVLRYADSSAAGGFATMKLAYDDGKRALVVDPGVALEPGRRLECLLLPGIVDADGLPLTPRHGAAAPDVIDVLRYHVKP